MVGMVNGSGLGLNYTSYTGTQGQAGVWNQGGLGLRGTKIFINGYTGNLIVQDQDGLLAAAGTDLQALRTYNSRGSFNDDNGDNWIAGFVRQAMRLTGGTWGADGSTVTVTLPPRWRVEPESSTTLPAAPVAGSVGSYPTWRVSPPTVWRPASPAFTRVVTARVGVPPVSALVTDIGGRFVVPPKTTR